MGGERDPVQEAASGDIDLYDITDWEPRTVLDRVSARVYRFLTASFRAVVIVLAFLILASQFLLSGLAAIRSPMLAVYIFASVVPALVLAGYVWKVDITMREPLELLVGTFVLGVLFAGFAAVLNTFFRDFFLIFGSIGVILFFYLIVAPVEETVKWLAIRLFAYRSNRFDAVVDGAVYGAVAGLGFATIENTLYIAEPYLNATGARAGLDQALQTAAVRTFAGPGHVIYSAFAGYYLGLAKFNPENRGPIIVKGLIIAALIHGTYNSVVTNLGAVVALVPGLGTVSTGIIFIAFIFIYDGVFFYILYRKIAAYRNAFVASDAGKYYDSDGELPDDHSEDTDTPDLDPSTESLEFEFENGPTEDDGDGETQTSGVPADASTEDTSDASIFDAIFVDDADDDADSNSK